MKEQTMKTIRNYSILMIFILLVAFNEIYKKSRDYAELQEEYESSQIENKGLKHAYNKHVKVIEGQNEWIQWRCSTDNLIGDHIKKCNLLNDL